MDFNKIFETNTNAIHLQLGSVICQEDKPHVSYSIDRLDLKKVHSNKKGTTKHPKKLNNVDL